MAKAGLVSVVIPTFNSEGTLQKCLESIKKQTYQNIEIIIVDNVSKDKTRQIATRFTRKIITEKLGMSAARNRGLRESKGAYFLSIDSDMELGGTVVGECVDKLSECHRCAGIIIPERSVGGSFWVKIRDFERQFYHNTDIESARFFRLGVVKKVGGYDEDVTFFEDSTLPQRIKRSNRGPFCRVKSEIMHHEDNFNIVDWLKKKTRYGRSAVKYVSKYPEFSRQKVSMPARYLIFLKDKRFYSEPILAAGVLILKTLEFVAVGLGIVVGMRTCQTCKKEYEGGLRRK